MHIKWLHQLTYIGRMLISDQPDIPYLIPFLLLPGQRKCMAAALVYSWIVLCDLLTQYRTGAGLYIVD
jgi:hypothetical protein